MAIKLFSKKLTIEVLTGLHIGAGKDTLEIGSLDNPVIRIKRVVNENNEIVEQPYIPGSSLKGKMRFLLEKYYGLDDLAKINSEKKEEQLIAKLFGSAPEKSSENSNVHTIPALIVRDFYLAEDLETHADNLTEVKWETKIDRKKGKAASGSLRQTERVIPGTKFTGELIIRIVEDEEQNIENLKKEYFKLVNLALNLLEQDYLGGSGTRGYGKIKIISEKDWTPIDINTNSEKNEQKT